MVKRVSDTILDDNGFQRLAEAMNKQNKKLFSIVDSEEQAKNIQIELMMSGKKASYEPAGGAFNIYSYDTAVMSPATQTLKTAGVYDYPFDDGSIWVLKTFDDGEQYLVKETQDEDENNVVRQKKAIANRQAIASSKIQSVAKFEGKIIDILRKNGRVVTSSLVNELRDTLFEAMYNSKSFENIIVKNSGKGATATCKKK